MKLFKSAIAVAAGTLFAGAAFAQPGHSIEQRDRAAQLRIERGVQSGQLTQREAARLRAGQAQVERLESHARADGVLTRHEYARIHAAQDQLSRRIYRETHDQQIAQYYHGPRGWERR